MLLSLKCLSILKAIPGMKHEKDFLHVEVDPIALVSGGGARVGADRVLGAEGEVETGLWGIRGNKRVRV